MIQNNENQKGFTLLMTLIVVSVVISVGLTILDLSIKQLKLSTNSKDSEVAFHAANAGIECAQYNRNANQTALEAGNNSVNFDCFGATNSPTSFKDNIPFTNESDAGNDVYKYTYEFDWGAGVDARCTEITMMLLTVGNVDNGITVNGATLRSEVPGYPDASKTCEPGGQCTILSVRGYSRSCANKDVHGAIQREVLLEF